MPWIHGLWAFYRLDFLLSNIYLRLLEVDSSFFTALNNFLSSYTTTYLSIYLLQDVLIASKFGNYEQNCDKHPCAAFYFDISLKILWSVFMGSYNKNMCRFVRNRQSVFHVACHSSFLPVINKCSYCSKIWPAFSVVRVMDLGHTDIDVVVPHCCFNLYILIDGCFKESLLMLIFHLLISFGDGFTNIYLLFSSSSSSSSHYC